MNSVFTSIIIIIKGDVCQNHSSIICETRLLRQLKIFRCELRHTHKSIFYEILQIDSVLSQKCLQEK